MPRPNSSSRLCEFMLFISTFSRRANRQTSVQKSRSTISDECLNVSDNIHTHIPIYEISFQKLAIG